jgi:hypothetical protein
MTVTPKLRIEVSKHLKGDFGNGQEYLALHGTIVTAPSVTNQQP